jgi:hypothetical protein
VRSSMSALTARCDRKRAVMLLHRSVPDSAVRQGNRDRCDHHFRDPDTPRDSDLSGRGRRQVHDATLDVRATIFDLDDGALARGDVGDFGHCSERQGPACGVVGARIHRNAVCHGSTEEFARVVRGLAETLARRKIGPRWPGNVLRSLWRSTWHGCRCGRRRQRDRKRGDQPERCCSGKAFHVVSSKSACREKLEFDGWFPSRGLRLGVHRSGLR